MNPLAPFHFKDHASSENAAAALSQPDRPAAFLIIGEPASGKTRLARLIVETQVGHAFAPTKPTNNHELTLNLNRAASAGVLFLDDLSARVLDLEQLHAFLALPEWTFRPFRTKTRTTIQNRTLTVITTNAKPIPGDLAVRVRTIHLVTKGRL